MKAKELITKVLVGNPKTIVSVFAMMFLIFSIQGIGYGAAPEFLSTETGERSVAENRAAGVPISPPVRATDADNERLTYSLSGTTNEDDVTFFEIGETTGQLRTAAVLNYEVPQDTDATTGNTAGDNVYVVTVTATDPGGLTDTIEVTITVTDVNEAPTFTDEDDDATNGVQINLRTVAENAPAGQNIGTDPVAATDPDDPTIGPDDTTGTGDTNPNTNADDDLIYTLTGSDARHFDIDSETGQLETKTVFNYEDPEDIGGTAGDNVYMVVVIVSDSESGGLSSRVTVTIEVTDENEAPQFLGPSNIPVTVATREVAENAMAGTSIGSPVTATDPDGDTLTYAVSDVDNFVIESNGQLKTKVMLGYEIQSSYTVTVTATDTDSLDNTIAVTIEVTDANDPPMFPSTENGARSIAENRGAVRVGSPVTAADPDGDTLTYGLSNVPGSTDKDAFTIDPRTGQLSTKAGGLDFEEQASYMVKVTVSDRKNDAGTSDTKNDAEITVTITVTNVNEPPAFPYDTALNRLYVYEGSSQAVIDPEGELEAKDPDADDTTLTYELSGPDAGIFQDDDNDGQLETRQTLAYATNKHAYTVTAIVRDTAGASDIITVTIRLVEVTTADPSDPAFADSTKAFKVTENLATLLIGQVEATDPDDDTLTYTLGDDDEEFFRIDTTTGQLYSKKPLDYESEEVTGGAYMVTVTVRDGSGRTDDIAVTINVINVNEKPMFVDKDGDDPILSDARAVDENTPASENIVPVLSTTDPEGKPLTYSLSGTDASSFAIVSVTDGGQLQTRDPLNFETKSEYMVMVTAYDGKLYSEPITVTITVTDVNDQPEFDDDRITLEIPEDTGTGVNIDMPGGSDG